MTQYIKLHLNNQDIPIGYIAKWDMLIPENKKIIDEITVTECPQEILDCFGQEEIENMIHEELINR